MNETIDKLSIEIDSQAGKSVSGIDTLIKKLEKLASTVSLNTTKLGKMNSALIAVGNTSKGMKNIDRIAKTTSVKKPTTEKAKTPSVTDIPAAPTGTFKGDAMSGADASKFDKVRSSANLLANSLKSAYAASGKVGKALSLIGKVGVAGVKATISTFKVLKKTMSSIVGAGKKVATTIGGAFSDLSKKLRVVSLALIGVRGLFTATRKAVNEYMNYDTELAETLRNNWAVLGSLMAPVLEHIIEMFSKAVAYINAFVKALFGVDLVARANAKALNKAGSAAKKAAKEYGNLAKFDDLNVIDFGKDSASGAGDSLKPLTVEEIDTTPIDRFLAFIKSNDWYGIGMEISRKFNDAMQMIDFDKILKEAQKWGKNMGDLFNGLTDGLDWGLLGNKIAGGLNSMMAFVNTFFDTYNFDHLGQGLARGMNSAIESIDWAGLGQFLTNKIAAIFEILTNFADGFNFSALGKALADGINSAINNIKLGNITSAMTKITQGFLNSLTSMFANLDISSIGTSINEAFANLDLYGVATALSTAFITALSSLGELLSTVNWAELGSQIAQFLLGIDWFGIMKTVIVVVGKAIIAITQLLWGYISTMLGDIWNKFIKWLDSTPFGHTLLGVFEEAWELIKVVWDKVEPYFKLAFDNIIRIFGPIAKQLGNFFGTAWELVKIVWDNVSSYFKAIFDSIKYVFSFVKSVLSGNFSDAWDAIKGLVGTWVDFFSGVWENIKKVFSVVKDFFKNTFKNAWDLAKGVFEGVADWFKLHVVDPIKGAFDLVWDGIKGVLNVMINGINKVINGINKIKIKIPSWVPEWGGKEWKLDIKPIDTLATGTNKIETEGLYHLHQGEAVLPKKYNPAVNNQAYEDGNNRVVDKLAQLINIVENMETTNIVNIGSREVHKGTQSYIKRQNNIYGTQTI